MSCLNDDAGKGNGGLCRVSAGSLIILLLVVAAGVVAALDVAVIAADAPRGSPSLMPPHIANVDAPAAPAAPVPACLLDEHLRPLVACSDHRRRAAAQVDPRPYRKAEDVMDCISSRPVFIVTTIKNGLIIQPINTRPVPSVRASGVPNFLLLRAEKQ